MQVESSATYAACILAFFWFRLDLLEGLDPVAWFIWNKVISVKGKGLPADFF